MGSEEQEGRTPKPVIRILKSSDESVALSMWLSIASSRLSFTTRRWSSMMGELGEMP